MLSAIIKQNNKTSYIFTDNSSKVYSGITIENDKVVPFNPNELDIFNIFKLNKKSFTRLDDYNNYMVLFDNNTNLKHYYKEGLEDYDMFFMNNGKIVTCFKDKDKLISKSLIAVAAIDFLLAIGDFTLVGGDKEIYLSGTYEYSDSLVSLTEYKDIDEFVISYNGETYKYSKNDLDGIIKTEIYNSINLTDLEKEYLYNEKLISDIQNSINNEEYIYGMALRHHNLNIIASDASKEVSGFYSLTNELFISSYDASNFDKYKSTVAHEYIHLLQDNYKYTLITEASAELISHEYFDTEIDSYYNEVALLEVLMEIIGENVVWDYNFNSSSTMLEDEVTKYLTQDEYNEFINLISITPSELDYNERYNLCSDILELLSTMYENKNNESISDNRLIQCILSLVNYNKYYFNDSALDEYTNYYVDKKDYDIDSAIDIGIVYMNNNIYEIDYDLFNELMYKYNSDLDKSLIDTSITVYIKDHKLYIYYKVYDNECIKVPNSLEELIEYRQKK